MNDSDKLKIARNLLRNLLKLESVNDHFRDKPEFFFKTMTACQEIGVVTESGGTYRLTSKEAVDTKTGPRHRGRFHA